MEEKINLLKHSQRITNTCERATSTLRSPSSSNLTHIIFTSIVNAETKKKAENEWQFEIQNKLLLSSWSENSISFLYQKSRLALCFIVSLFYYYYYYSLYGFILSLFSYRIFCFFLFYY